MTIFSIRLLLSLSLLIAKSILSRLCVALRLINQTLCGICLGAFSAIEEYLLWCSNSGSCLSRPLSFQLVPYSPIICQFAQPVALATRSTDQITVRGWRLYVEGRLLLRINHLSATGLPPMSLRNLDGLESAKHRQAAVPGEKRRVLCMLEAFFEILVTSFVLFNYKLLDHGVRDARRWFAELCEVSSHVMKPFAIVSLTWLLPFQFFIICIFHPFFLQR